MAEQNNQMARVLKWLDAKEPNPFSLNVREMRGRSVIEELHTPSFRQPPPSSIHVHGAVQNYKINGICLPPPINQSTPVLVSSLLPQWSSDLDTDQGDIISETIKQVAQSVNQTLSNPSTGIPTSYLTPNDSPHDRTPNRQSILNPNLSDIHTQTKTQPTHTYRPASPKNSITHPVTNF